MPAPSMNTDLCAPLATIVRRDIDSAPPALFFRPSLVPIPDAVAPGGSTRSDWWSEFGLYSSGFIAALFHVVSLAA